MKKFRRVLFFIVIFILLLISFSLNWVAANFNGVGFDEILFHLHMPLNGAGSYVNNYLHKALLPAVGILAEILVAIVFIKVFLDMKLALRDKLRAFFSPIIKHSTLIGLLIIIVWFSAVSYRAQSWFGLYVHFAPLSGHRCVCRRTLGGGNGQRFNQSLSVLS